MIYLSTLKKNNWLFLFSLPHFFFLWDTKKTIQKNEHQQENELKIVNVSALFHKLAL